jgi:hypothetical protein
LHSHGGWVIDGRAAAIAEAGGVAKFGAALGANTGESAAAVLAEARIVAVFVVAGRAEQRESLQFTYE